MFARKKHGKLKIYPTNFKSSSDELKEFERQNKVLK